MDHTTIAASTLVTAMPFAWEPEGSGDFDGDGNDEILWQNRQTGEVAMWTMSGGTLLNGSVFYTLTDLNWTVQPRGGIRPALDSQ
jgi:hypothetical protein